MNAENLEKVLDEQMLILEDSLFEKGMEMAVLIASIGKIDDTLYAFRDLAGRALKNGDGSIMFRYRIQKEKLLGLVDKYKEMSGIDLYDKLKCNS